MKVGDLVKVYTPHTSTWHGQLGIIVSITVSSVDWRATHGTMLISGAKRWFGLDELELVE
jgi:hypothetical protein